MTQLVALLSTGKGTWADVAGLITKEEFSEIFILTNAFGKEKFVNLPSKPVHVHTFDFNKPIDVLQKDFVQALSGKLQFTDVAVNMSSGSGNEHMALFSALISLGVGIRLVALKDGVIITL
ncbi:MAG: hypothetical protein ACMXYE_02075 [Candidatus Woesearchaeota archaeon]